MLSLFIFFLIFFVPGFIAVLMYELVSGHRIKTCFRSITTALVFDLLILIINLIGLYIFKSIHTIDKLICYFNCISFTSKYAILSIVVGIVISLIASIIFGKRFWKKHCKYRDVN